MACSNCGAPMNCGCQQKIASDGRSCCNNCIHAYENKIAAENVAKQINLQPFTHPMEHLYNNGQPQRT